MVRIVGRVRGSCSWDVRGMRSLGVLVRAEGAREARSWCGSLGARSVCSLPARGALAGRARAAPPAPSRAAPPAPSRAKMVSRNYLPYF